MSLSAQEQQALESIEDRLTGSDPKLALLLATFARLTSGEEMPVREKIRAQLRRPARRRYPRPQGVSQPASRPGRRLARGRVMLLLALAAVIAVTAVVLIINSGGRTPTCTGSWALVCAQQASTHSSRPTGPEMARR